VEARALREKAERCRRLAHSIYNDGLSSDLETYARSLEEQAKALEESTALPRTITDLIDIDRKDASLTE
jgi:hypothetical protein